MRVSQVAYDRFKERVEAEGVTQTYLLEVTIIQGLEKRSYQVGTEAHPVVRYYYPPKTGKTRRRRGATGEKELRLWIGSTAWNKLEAEADATGESKSRIVNRLFLTHQWITETQRRLNREAEERIANYEFILPEPPTPEMVENSRRELDRIITEREERWERFAQQVIASRVEREE